MKLIYLLVLAVLLSTVTNAQTFKVTGFVSDTKRFDDIEAKVMGKPLKLDVYDKSISVKLADEDAKLMHKVTDNEYLLDLSKPGSVETLKLTLKLVKTVGFTTSVELTFTAAENKGQYRHNYWKIIAKRF